MSGGTSKVSTSRISADEVISWLREYAAARINSHLIDERRCIPPYIVLDFGNHGLFGLRVPKHYGGLDLTQADVVRVLEQLGGIDLTLATFLSSHANGVHTVQEYGCSALREELLSKLASGREISAFALTEPYAGSNPRAIQTRAVQDSRGGWVLNGEKYLVDSGSWASVITVFAQTSPGMSAFAVRQGTQGLVIGGESLTMGLRGMVQNIMSLRDVHVRAESLLGSPGTGATIIQDTLSLARLNLAAKSIGGMKRCLQLMHRYARRRPVATGMLWDNPVTQSRMVQLVSAVSVIEALVGRISTSLDVGEKVPTEAFLACKVAGSEYLWKTADTLVQVMGGRGYVDTNVASQILRDARSFLLSEGPTETLLMYLGSRVIHMGTELERFIAMGLGAPSVAHRLNEITEQIRAQHSKGSPFEGIGEPNGSYWVSWLAGKVAMWAILAAAVENSDLKGHEVAQAWAYSKFEERITALAKFDLSEWALGHGKAVEDLIASYTESIGEVEQSLPAAVTELDLLLRRSKAPSVSEEHGSNASPEEPAGGDGTAFEATWAKDVAVGVSALASSKGVREKTVLVAVLGALLYRHTGQERVRICLQNGSTPGLDVWMEFGDRPSLEDLVEQVIRALGARPGDSTINPNEDELRVRVILATRPCALERDIPAAALTVIVQGDDVRKTEWRYDGQSLGQVTAPKIAARLEELIRSWITHPRATVSRLSILPSEERALLVYDWNETGSSYPKDACIHQLFEQQVARAPERVAVVFDGEALSYGELDARADRLARKLRQIGVGWGVLVGLCVDRSPDLLVSLLGILKAGGAYVPLDATHPARRLAQILDETRVPVIVAHPHLAAMLPEHSAHVVRPDAWKEIEAFERKEIVVEAPTAEQCAYVLYTSGSTGRPKGVEVCHRSVVNFLFAMRERPGLSENDVLVAVTTISFDIAALELLLPLVTGGRVVLANRRTALDGTELAKLIEESGATVLQATPSTWQMLLVSGWQGRPGLKALCGGESLPRELARSIQTRTASLWNLYGPAETTIWSSVEKVTEHSGPITIGRPIANTSLYLLNEDFEPVPVGVSGEIFIGGDGVAQGYWKRPDLTAERFLPDPFRPGERMYRTGDLARFLPDGRIEYLGRLDHQVKIRGFRIELGDIETALASHRGVREAAVAARHYAPGDTRLVAYVTLSSGTARQSLIPELQKHVREYVPTYMVPSAFVVLDSFPLTPNGKMDRAALPAPQPEDIISEGHKEPYASPVEEEIKSIWSNVLRISTFNREDDFFALGGHSLLATQVASQLRKAFGVEIPIALIFERPTVAALARAIQDALGVFAAEAQPSSHAGDELPCPALEPIERGRKIELSFAQERLWFLDQLVPGSAQYHIPVALRLDGRLQVEVLRSAFEQLVGRHEGLRARFESRDGQPFQVIESAGSWPLPVVDLESLPKEQRQAERERLIQKEITRPFDLRSGPLLRTMLLRLTPDEHVLLVTMHHIVSDGWSMEVLLRELGVVYAALSQGCSSPLLPLPFQYVDYSVWQRKWLQGRELERQLAYWRKQLAGLPVLNLPADHPHCTAQSDRGATHGFALSAELSAALLRIGQKQGATMFVTLVAAFQALLSRYSGQEDFGIGFPIANRMRTEVEGLIGCFVNTLVLRADLSGNPTYKEILARVRKHALKAYAHQAVPFERLVQELRSPLFRVMFALQNAPAAEFALPGLQVTPLPVTTNTAKFDLTLSMREHEGRLLGDVEYNTDLFETSTIERMLGHFQVLLRGIVDNPEAPMGRLSLLTEAERHQLVIEWNDTKTDYPKSKSIHQLFEEQAERTPNATAAVFEDQKLSYRELNQQANQLGHYLIKLGVGPEALVGICLERSFKLVVGMLGILKAGGAYLPLDPSYPKERLAFMLEDTKAVFLLTQECLVENLPEHGGRVVCLDKDWEQIAQESNDNPTTAITSDNLAYVIYTSGSTGKPKGVAIEHRSAVAFLSWAHTVFTSEDMASVLASTSICFDLSVFELFAPLTSGGKVILAQNALALAALPAASQVTLVNTVPSAIAELLRMDGIPPSVSTICLAGEPLKSSLVKDIYERTSATKVYDLYGPSEATTYSTFALRTPTGSQTIGRPIVNTLIYILDSNLQPVPIGVSGELHIGGDGLARGYINRPELTAEKFIPDPFSKEPGERVYRTGDLGRYLADGNIELLGRLDNQLKIRGFRIEPGEIEASLNQHPGVQNSVVVARKNRSAETHLVAYIVPKQQFETAVSDIPWPELENQELSNWEMLFEETFADAREPEDPTTNTAGVNSSYTNAPIPAEESRDWVDHAANRILSLKPNRVLDIGCGLGRTLFRVAPQCKQYWGTDFSQVALDYVEQHLDLLGDKRGGVKLIRARADDFSAIPKSHFDTVIINGVVQYLPHIDHLVNVLERALSAVEPGGVIFVGDVRSLPLLEAFQLSVDLYQSPDDLPTDLLWQRVKRNVAHDAELVIDPIFFEALGHSLHGIGCVDILLKRGWAQNELTRFRYDVILYAEPQVQPHQNIPSLDWIKEKLTLGLLRQRLADRPEALGIAGVPNARVLPEFRAAGSLAKDGQPTTAIELRHAIEAIREDTFHPETFWALEDDLPYSVDIQWSRTGAEFFDVFLKRRSLNGDRRLPTSVSEKIITSLPWRSYAHNPVEVKLNQTFRSSLRSLVEKRLPSYMMPSAFVFLDSLPRSPNGKVDRNALPAPELTGFELEQNFIVPRTPVEKALARIWADLLGLDQVGVHANFFDLGGHSLLATQVMSRLQSELQVELPLRTIFEQPTIASLALVITEMQPAKAEQTDVLGMLAEIEALSEDEAKRLIARNSEAKKI